MSEPVDRQPATAAERREHEDDRFKHMEDQAKWEQEAQSRKNKIIAGFVTVGALLWAWAAMY
jgi:hypothetical protein